MRGIVLMILQHAAGAGHPEICKQLLHMGLREGLNDTSG